jgi:hypothetical protein
MAAQHGAIICTIQNPTVNNAAPDTDTDQVNRLVSQPVSRPKNDTRKSQTISASPCPGSIGQAQSVQPETEKLSSLQWSSNMIYIWQNPMMQMAWSCVMFIVGLLLQITAPLRDDLDSGDNRKSAVSVLVFGGLLGINLAWGSFWMYRAAAHVSEEDVENGRS